ncbi:unnamed protein product [Peronospora belbahrii]|uniref:Tubulin-specific chaperone A n=1 Tax=Peronospora belbahrii TaxID=622444 RepID=A0ABN8D1R1_9STRA|nr:unnamed protein product [Peronospora belbahrii]
MQSASKSIRVNRVESTSPYQQRLLAKVKALEKQVAKLQDVIETMTLEKETVEMDMEIAKEHAEKLQQEVEKLTAAMALSAGTGRDCSEGSLAEIEELTAKKNKLESEAEELKEMLDIANAYKTMVNLTEKKI